MRTVSRVILSAILLVLTAVLSAVAIYAPDAFFSFYPDFSRKAEGVLATITGPLPVALWEILVLLLVLWVLYTLIRCIVRKSGFVRWLAGLLVGGVRQTHHIEGGQPSRQRALHQHLVSGNALEPQGAN